MTLLGRALRRALVAFAFFGASAITLAFLALPLIALVTDRPPAALFDQLSNPVVTDALVVSLETSAASLALALAFGTPLAYLLATRRFPGRGALITLVELPIVMPPAVAGIGLLVAFGRFGLLGGTFSALGIDVAFNKAAVILAVTFVAGPLYVRTAIAAFQGIDRRLLAASRTLGAGPARTFFRVALPLAGNGLAAGTALALARGLGEFGATLMFAGSLKGVTQTLPLAIYYVFDINLDTGLAISALFLIIIAAVLMALKLTALWQTSRSASRSRFAISASR